MQRTRFPRRIPALLACAALLTAASAVDAQTAVRTGSTVRLLAPSAADTLITGTIVAIDSASLLLATRHDGPLRVPYAGIRQLEAGTRRRGDARTLGVAGAVLGAVVALSRVESGPCEGCGLVPVRALAAVAGAGAGYLAGALIGRAAASREWRAVPVPAGGQP